MLTTYPHLVPYFRTDLRYTSMEMTKLIMGCTASTNFIHNLKDKIIIPFHKSDLTSFLPCMYMCPVNHSPTYLQAHSYLKLPTFTSITGISLSLPFSEDKVAVVNLYRAIQHGQPKAAGKILTNR
jgi:hypothetical protein